MENICTPPYNNATGGKGHKALVRYQWNDSVPFFKSFDGYIEMWDTGSQSLKNYAVTAYWYLDPDGTDPYGPRTLSDRKAYYENNAFAALDTLPVLP